VGLVRIISEILGDIVNCKEGESVRAGFGRLAPVQRLEKASLFITQASNLGIEVGPTMQTFSRFCARIRHTASWCGASNRGVGQQCRGPAAKAPSLRIQSEATTRKRCAYAFYRHPMRFRGAGNTQYLHLPAPMHQTLCPDVAPMNDTPVICCLMMHHCDCHPFLPYYSVFPSDINLSLLCFLRGIIQFQSVDLMLVVLRGIAR